MENIIVNIVSYSDSDHSLIVNFSDGTVTTGNVAFQPYNYPNTSPTEVMKAIALNGVDMLELHKNKVTYKESPHVDSFAALANTSVTFNVADLKTEKTIADGGLEVSI
jgi:hypothetical protein